MDITNEVLFERLNNLIDSNHESHTEINNHLKIMNESIIKLKTWRGFISGGLTVIGAMAIPVVLMIFSKFLSG